MLAPLSPLDAYRFDLDRQHRRSEFGNADTVWLLLAHCLGRISKVGDAVRDQLALQSANALRDLAESAPDGDAHEGAHINDLRMMIAGLSAIETRAGADAVSRACRGFAARMAESGALSVAYSVTGPMPRATSCPTTRRPCARAAATLSSTLPLTSTTPCRS